MRMPADPADLDLTPAQMRSMGEAVLSRVIEHLASLPEQPARGDVCAEELCRSLREPAPEHGADLDKLLNLLFDDCIPRSFNPASAGYLAFIPGGGLFPAALADLIADATNRFTGVWRAAPALVQLEANVLDWFRDWMGFPAGTRGLLTTGGSMATFSAILCARERLLGPHLRAGVLYTSEQAHNSVGKSAKLAGILPDRVRTVPVDAHFRMELPALEEAIDADLSSGLKPFLVVSTAGTTGTGAVDPLGPIADLCACRGLWHHVDGAYGAFFRLVEGLRPVVAGMERADSLTLDPHKGLFLPYGTGALLVRDGAALKAVHGTGAGYLPAEATDEFYDPAQYGPDLSRGFPGLRVWLTVKLYGAARLRAALEEKHELAVWAAERLADVPGIVLVAPPELSLLAFRLEVPGASPAVEDSATRRLLERVSARGRVMLTGCTAGGRFVGRICVLCFRTRSPDVEAAVAQLAEEAAVLRTEMAGI